MFALTADDVLVRIRERIHDRAAQTFDDAEVLRAADDSLRSIYDILRIHSEEHGLDSLDVNATTDVTLLEHGVRQYELPEWVGDIQMLEGVGAANNIPVPITKASLEEKDMSRGFFRSAGTMWNWGPPGTIQIRGDIPQFQTLRIWFTRSIPPMCYALGSGVGSTTTLLTNLASSQGMLLRAGAYEKVRFQVMEGATGDLSKLVRCSGFTVAAGTATLTFAPALGTATGTTTKLSMVVPLDPQHSEYLCALASLTLMTRQGSKEEIAVAASEAGRLQETFERGIARRSSGEPPRLSSSRRWR